MVTVPRSGLVSDNHTCSFSFLNSGIWGFGSESGHEAFHFFGALCLDFGLGKPFQGFPSSSLFSLNSGYLRPLPPLFAYRLLCKVNLVIIELFD